MRRCGHLDGRILFKALDDLRRQHHIDSEGNTVREIDLVGDRVKLVPFGRAFILDRLSLNVN